MNNYQRQKSHLQITAENRLKQCLLGMAGMAVLVSAYLVSASASAASLGMVMDNQSYQLRLFNADTDVVVASHQGSATQLSGDCALSRDESIGFSSHADRLISIHQLALPGAEAELETSSIKISNAGVDMSLSPDGSLLVSSGAGIAYEPLSIIDTALKIEVAVAAPFLDHTSAEFCDDGTLLVTTTYGDSFALPFDNAIYDARVSSAGELQLGGHRLSSGAQPNNSSCAPGSRAGVLLDREAGLTSFTLPGLEQVDFANLHGTTAVAAVFSYGGDRLYVRTTETVEAFDFNPINGQMRADWVQAVPYSSEYFGIDQIALHPETGKLYVDGGQSLLILDTATGTQNAWIDVGDTTGICFANREPHTVVNNIVFNAP